jgi:hypothetical protein
MTIDHVALFVSPSQFDSIVTWYLTALAPLGYSKQIDFLKAVGLGPSKPEARFWIFASETAPEKSGLHLAFRAESHAAVNKFHEEALKAGGKDNGEPGLRASYHPNYYAAFALDPLG